MNLKKILKEMEDVMMMVIAKVEDNVKCLTGPIHIVKVKQTVLQVFQHRQFSMIIQKTEQSDFCKQENLLLLLQKLAHLPTLQEIILNQKKKRRNQRHV